MNRSQRTATGLSLFSLGLASVQIGAPGLVARLVGANDTRRNRDVVRLVCGVRELASAFAVGATRHPTPGLWARVAGDAVDLGLLTAILVKHPDRRLRALAAAAAVMGVMAVDAFGAMRSARSADRGSDDVTVQAAVTVRRPVRDVYAYWRDFEHLPRFMTHLTEVTDLGSGVSRWTATGPAGTSVTWEAELTADVPEELIAWRSRPDAAVSNSGTVRFGAAPANRGTEVRVQLAYRPPAGRLGAGLAALLGESPRQQIRDDLRRFKQVMETGEVVRSESTPSGIRSTRQLAQYPAQPLPQ